MAAEQNQSAGDPITELEKFFKPRRTRKLNRSFKQLDKTRYNLEPEGWREQILQKLGNTARNKNCQRVAILIVLSGFAVSLLAKYDRDSSVENHQKNMRQAEAIVNVLRLPDAIRSLNLTAEQLSYAEGSNNSNADEFGGVSAVGYRDLTKLDMAASVVALAAHNSDTTIDTYPDQASYTVGVEGGASVMLTGSEVLYPSQEVAADIAKYYASTIAATP